MNFTDSSSFRSGILARSHATARGTLAGRPESSHKRIYRATLMGAGLTVASQAIGGAPDALRMQRVFSFYEKLPRGAAPEIKSRGLLGWYQAKYFGKNASAKRTCLPGLPRFQDEFTNCRMISHRPRPRFLGRYWLRSELLFPPPYVDPCLHTMICAGHD